MAFKVSEIETKEFYRFSDIEEYVRKEEESLNYVPIYDFLRNDSTFMDDEFFGRGKNWISFNENGFSEFCNLLNIPCQFMKDIGEKGLTTKVLNDSIMKKTNYDKVKKYKFVIDKNDNTCIGIVSNTYLVYSNYKFLNDLNKLFQNMLNDYKIQEGFCYNTKLYLRMVSTEIKVGNIHGIGGEGEDICKIGLQLSNSMIGDSSVRVELFIYRLLCANGLIMQTANISGKVFHSGKVDTFLERLKKQLSPISTELKNVRKQIKILLEIEYIPESLVDLNGHDYIYKILPLSNEIKEKRRKLKEDQKYQFDLELIREYPEKYGLDLSKKVFNSYWRDNQSLFDFVNIFTEYAHSPGINIESRIEIERKTGEFVIWIINNQKKLKEANMRYNSSYNYY